MNDRLRNALTQGSGDAARRLVWRMRAQWKIRGLLWLQRAGLLPRLNLRWRVVQQDHALEIPIIAGAGLQNIFMTERWMEALLAELFRHRPHGTFIDIGVNVGQTLIKLRRLRPAQPYLGFEPNPSCLHYLSELFRFNEFGEARVLPIALGNETCLRELVYYDAEDAVSSSASLRGAEFRPFKPVAARRIVPVMPFGDVVSAHLREEVGIIKIDVEGVEEPVLGTLFPLLRVSRAPVLVEILPEPVRALNVAKNARLMQMLSDLDYAIHRVRIERDRYEGLDPIREIGTNQDPNGWDYLLLPRELAVNIPLNPPADAGGSVQSPAAGKPARRSPLP